MQTALQDKLTRDVDVEKRDVVVLTKDEFITQVNAITAWLDGSMVYGSDAATAASLRTSQGGKLKTSAGNLLPTDAAGTSTPATPG